MAMDDFDPEVMRELLGNLEALSAAMGPLAVKMGQMSGSIDQTGAAVNKEGEAIKANVKYREGESKAVQASRQAQQELTAASEALTAGFTNLKGATTSFADALLKGEGQFSSYNKALGGLGDAAFQAGKAFGPLGMAIGGAVKAITAVGQVFTEQADAQNQFVTQMYKMGAGVSQSSESLTDLARAAGYPAEDLEKLAPIIQSTSTNLASLGGTTGEGTTKLMGMFKYANENERAFFRLGYSLEELQEVQGSYLELQSRAGINLQSQNLTQEQLNKRSTDYAKQLRVMGELTGKSVEQLQKEQQQAVMTFENNAANLASRAKLRELDEQIAQETNEEKRAQLQAERDRLKNLSEGTTDAIAQFGNRLTTEQAQQLGRLIRTGAYDENTRGLAVLGIGAADLKQRFDEIADIQDETARNEARQALIDETVQKMADAQMDTANRLGTATQFMGEEAGRMMGLTTEGMQATINIAKDAAEQREEAEEGVNRRMREGADPQRDANAALIDFERSVRTSADEALDSLNPLTNGFDKATLALQGLTVAVGVAAATMMMGGLGGGGAGGIMSKLGGLFGRGGGAAASAASGAASGAGGALGQAGVKALGAVGKLAGPLAAVVEVGRGVYSAMEGRERAEQNLAEGKISEEEADRRKTQETAEGAGQAVGGAGGAAIGAMIGTAILPGVGTVVGGMLGAWLGGQAGDEIGGAIGEAMTITPEMEEYNRANLDLVSQMGIYNENWLGASEVNMEALRAGIEEGTVTKDMVQAMMMDNDLTDQQLQELTDIAAGMEGPGVEALTAGASEEEMAAMLAEREQRQSDLLDQQQQAEADRIAEEERERVAREELLAQQRENEKEQALLLREQRLADAERKRQEEALAQGAEEANAALAALSGQAGDAIETASEGLILSANQVGLASEDLVPEAGKSESSLFDFVKKAAMALVPGGGLLASAADGIMGMFSSEPNLDTVEGRRELFAEGTDEDWAGQRGGALGGYTEHLANELELVGLDAASATEEQMAAIKEKAKRSFLDDKYGTEITSETVHEGDLAGNEMFTDYIKSVNALGEILITTTKETTGADGEYNVEQFTQFANTVQGSLDRADGMQIYTDGEEYLTGDLASHNFVDVWNAEVMPGLNELMSMNSQQVADAIQEKEMESADEGTIASETEATQVNQTNVNIEQLLAQNAQLMNMMENRLGSVVSKLDDANEIQSKILQYGRV